VAGAGLAAVGARGAEAEVERSAAGVLFAVRTLSLLYVTAK
jgi:hypothetical protein